MVIMPRAIGRRRNVPSGCACGLRTQTPSSDMPRVWPCVCVWGLRVASVGCRWRGASFRVVASVTTCTCTYGRSYMFLLEHLLSTVPCVRPTGCHPASRSIVNDGSRLAARIGCVLCCLAQHASARSYWRDAARFAIRASLHCDNSQTCSERLQAHQSRESTGWLSLHCAGR